jgi:TRAP-type mannitol/chloroaromatic compound transport system permease large subunit
VKLATGVITAGGTLGILIPPSVMIIVYAAVAGQSVVKLYASAMFPGFFLAFLYLVYIVGWALINPKIAPRLPESQTRVPVPEWATTLQQAYSRNMLVALVRAIASPAKAVTIAAGDGRVTYRMLLQNFATALVPIGMTVIMFWGVWWYVVIHQQASNDQDFGVPTATQQTAPPPTGDAAATSDGEPEALGVDAGPTAPPSSTEAEPLEQLGNPELLQGPLTPAEQGPPAGFYLWFGISVAAGALCSSTTGPEQQFQVLKLPTSSVMPLGILTIIALAVIPFRHHHPTEPPRSAPLAPSAGDPGADAQLAAGQVPCPDAKTTAMVCWLRRLGCSPPCSPFSADSSWSSNGCWR